MHICLKKIQALYLYWFLVILQTAEALRISYAERMSLQKIAKSFSRGIFFPALLFAALFYSCGNGLFDRRISEGIIEYDVTYPNIDPDDMLAGLMPTSMTMKFKKNQFNAELSAGMGMFKTNFISNSNDYFLINSVKLINKKYATRLDKKAVEKMNEKYSKFYISKINEKKEIAGYNCKKALVVFDDVTNESFYVYYTNDIHIDNPNWSNIFKEIDGVLLEYQMERYGIMMKFTAKSITKAELNDSEFQLTSDYENLTLADLEKEINSIFDTFK